MDSLSEKRMKGFIGDPRTHFGISKTFRLQSASEKSLGLLMTADCGTGKSLTCSCQ
jgi:hypothetical protein